MRGNDAIGEAAVKAGCQAYFGYPITPQNELTEYMARRMLDFKDRVFIQSESEISAINMVFGASVAGARAMTSSSSPGISLKQEGISFLCGCELPAVVVNVMRGGPGLGNIAPAQSDYFQATRGGGHGDYRTIVLAPASVQESADLTMDAFELADKYRNPVIILIDGMMGQMMEPVVFKEEVKSLPKKDWALTGAKGRKSRFIRSLILDTDEMEMHNWDLYRKYQRIEENEVRYETYQTDDAEILAVAYGTAGRITKAAIRRAREKGVKIGLLRPITLWPFPKKVIEEYCKKVRFIIVFEMSCGQMVEDVKLAVEGKRKVVFYGRPGGIIPTPIEYYKVILREMKLAE